MLRVSVTDIEQHRRFMTYEYVQESAMIAKIRRIPIAPTEPMRIGKAFHSVLENYEKIVAIEEHARLLNIDPFGPGEDKVVPVFQPMGGINHENYVQCGEYIFNRHHVAKAREFIGHCLWEVKGNRVFQTSYGPVNVIAKADNVWGTKVQDSKVKFVRPDGQDWEWDCQKDFYMLVHGAHIFQHNAFTFHKPLELPDTPGVFLMELIDFIYFRFFPYEAMEQRCMMLLTEFLAWADSHNLLPFLHRETE